MWTAPNPPSHPAVIASITGMVARMITDYSIHGCTHVYGKTEHRPWLLITHGGEITDSGGGYYLVARPPPTYQTQWPPGGLGTLSAHYFGPGHVQYNT